MTQNGGIRKTHRLSRRRLYFSIKWFSAFSPKRRELLSIIHVFTAQENLKRLQSRCRQLESRNKALAVSGLLEEPSHSAPPLQRAKHHHTFSCQPPSKQSSFKGIISLYTLPSVRAIDREEPSDFMESELLQLEEFLPYMLSQISVSFKELLQIGRNVSLLRSLRSRLSLLSPSTKVRFYPSVRIS